MNRLSEQTSPYLRQHQDNPVDWQPFGEEACIEAARRDVPLFISIGYAACHWCHVMAHESFEDETTAKKMNELFVCVKVDREERPDVDAIYIDAVQAMNGQAGWPLSVFTTPDGRPMYGGTYFPKERSANSPSFNDVMDAVSGAWKTERDSMYDHAAKVTDAIRARLDRPSATSSPGATRTAQPAGPGSNGALSGSSETVSSPYETMMDAALGRLDGLFDSEFAGIGRAPKFPQAPILEIWVRAASEGNQDALEKLTKTLHAMAGGGIYDHLGGGFARYATDRAWHIPHFEKMLYDQAMLARTYLHVWQFTNQPQWRQVVSETLDYVLGDLKDPAGGLWSSRDADSEGEEGRFYLWSPDELNEVLGRARGEEFAEYYRVTQSGNFEGRSILRRPAGADLIRPASIEQSRAELVAARATRVAPDIDDKVLLEWNAMTASVLAEAGAAMSRPDWIDAAKQIAGFLVSNCKDSNGRYMRSYHDGRLSHLAYSTDYAWLIECCTRIGEATGDPYWTDQAILTADELDRLFVAGEGGYYLTGVDAEELIVRPREFQDGVTPSANSVAALALARLACLTGNEVFTANARRIVQAVGDELTLHPLMFPGLVATVDLLEHGAVEVVIAGDRPDLVQAAQRRFTRNGVIAFGTPTASLLWEGRDGNRAYVCKAGMCLAPVDDVDGLISAISAAETS